MKKHKGFTLIELLVVISIISLLSSIVMSSLSESRANALDSRRKSDLIQLRNALELYYLDHNEYPSTLNAGGDSVDPFSKAQNGGPTDNWIPGLAPTYIPELPDDPLFSDPLECSGHGNTYTYYSNGQKYKLVANVQNGLNCTTLTNADSMNENDVFYDYSRADNAFMITNDRTIPPLRGVEICDEYGSGDVDTSLCW